MVHRKSREHPRAHGEPLGEEELNAAKTNLGWPTEPRFLIPGKVLEFYREAVEKGRKREVDWKMKFDAYKLSVSRPGCKAVAGVHRSIP